MRTVEYQKSGIGLERGKVFLSPFSPKWKRCFSEEAYFVFDQLKDESLRLYHCGSTSIPGLEAKPIIDIVGSVASLGNLDANSDRLERIGYEYKGEYGIPGRRYSVLYNQEKTVAYIHLHLFEHGNPAVERHLAFRDYLRKSDPARAEYGQEKSRIIQSNAPRAEYSNAKAPIIEKLEGEALAQSLEASSQTSVLAIVGAADGHQNTKQYVLESFPQKKLELIDLSISNVSGFSYGKMADDHFITIVEKMIKADLVVLATPVYWYTMAGPMKDYVDRFSNLMSGKHKELGEALYGKRLKVLSTGYDQAPPLGFEVPFSATAIYFGIDYLGCSYRSTR